MKRADYPEEIRRLISELKRLPGIGPRSAERMALHLLREQAAPALAEALSAASGVTFCPVCGFFQSAGLACALCGDDRRDARLLCVVEQPHDVLAIERTGAFNGRYHVLGGKLSPLDNVHPEDLRIDSLLQRASTGQLTEVILAIGSDLEGEATAHYLSGLLARPGLGVSRLAQGLPAGNALEHIDELTLQRALSGRKPL